MKVVAKRHCRRFCTVDLAFTTKKENDYFVICLWAVTPGQDLLLLDLLRDRLEGPDIEKIIIRLWDQWKPAYVAIEATQAQLVVVQSLRKKGLTVRGLTADKDKLSRAIPATVRMEAGQIFVPKSAPWLGDWIEELLYFPKGTHDDQVDCLSYAAIEVQRYGGASPEGYHKVREQGQDELEREAAKRWWREAEGDAGWEGDE